jgi:predicted N-acyltransferase
MPKHLSRICGRIGWVDTMNFDIQVAHSLEEIDQETWDYLGEGRPFSSYRWYRFGETVLSGDTPIYIILSQGGQAVARGTFWLKRQEPVPIASKPVRRFIEMMLQRWPLSVCRSPLTSTSGLILPEPPLRDMGLKTVAQVAQEEARRYQASLVVFDYLECHQTQWLGWPDTFTPVAIPDPGTRLVITWADFESYLKHLRKSVRKDYQRHHNRAADLGIVIKRHPMVTNLDEAIPLIRDVEKHHNSAPNPLVRSILENAYMIDAAWLTAEIAERMVGCGLLLGDGGTWFLALLGLDYNVQYVYFQLVYAAIRYAVEAGVQVLQGGGGVYEMKQRLGFQLESNNYVTFAASNPVLRWLGQRLTLS